MLVGDMGDELVIVIDCPSCGGTIGFLESQVKHIDPNNGTLYCCYCRHEIQLTGMDGVCEHDEEIEG